MFAEYQKGATENEISRLQSENTSLKAELKGMQETIYQLQEQMSKVGYVPNRPPQSHYNLSNHDQWYHYQRVPSHLSAFNGSLDNGALSGSISVLPAQLSTSATPRPSYTPLNARKRSRGDENPKEETSTCTQVSQWPIAPTPKMPERVLRRGEAENEESGENPKPSKLLKRTSGDDTASLPRTAPTASSAVDFLPCSGGGSGARDTYSVTPHHTGLGTPSKSVTTAAPAHVKDSGIRHTQTTSQVDIPLTVPSWGGDSNSSGVNGLRDAKENDEELKVLLHHFSFLFDSGMMMYTCKECKYVLSVHLPLACH
ncbi:hypothetical protein AAF712_006637 [Marasmius tenuissimus]|uniref:Uncharacterized protein n=1 Tax=Marasmius tenuissimus TaxID=585030 RepID=A0ABR3A035_9AGAR